MKKMFSILLVLALATSLLVGCGGNSDKSGSVKVDPGTDNASVKVETPGATVTATLGKGGDHLLLPERFPKNIVPLPDDANIVNVRDNGNNGALGIAYVTGKDEDTLLEFYKTALKSAKDLRTDKKDTGYMIMGDMNDIQVTILLSKGMFKSIPEYADKLGVNIELGMQKVTGSSSSAGLTPTIGKQWPAAELPGVPVLKGNIESVSKGDTVIVNVMVNGMDTVMKYVEDLKSAGFTSDSYPESGSDYVEFVAFKEDFFINFSYDDKEESAMLEYGKN